MATAESRETKQGEDKPTREVVRLGAAFDSPLATFLGAPIQVDRLSLKLLGVAQ